MYLNINDLKKGIRSEVLTIITREEENALQAIADAQAEVEGYLSARYDIATELARTPEDEGRITMVVKLVRDIAIYNCYNFSAQVNMPQSRITAYENAIKFLRDCQSEKASIPDLQRLNATTGGGTSSNYIYYSGNPKRNHHI